MSRGMLSAIVVVGGLGFVTAQPAFASVSTEQVSVNHRGGDPDRDSYHVAMSPDGRYVAFASEASDLVPDDHTLHCSDVFVRDTVADTTVRASVDVDGGDPDNCSASPTISADGRYVAFESGASDLVGGGCGEDGIFVRDVVAGTTLRVDLDTQGRCPENGGAEPSISADGRYVAFWSSASDLVANDRNDDPDIFVRDLVAGTTVRASVDPAGGDANSSSFAPSLSADGRYVAFESYASNLIYRDERRFGDIFIRDLLEGTTIRASVDPDGREPLGDSTFPWLSADGRHVAFHSQAANLVDDDCSGGLFVHDLAAGVTVRANVAADGACPETGGGLPALSGDGRYVTFYSLASDLVDDDRNGEEDIFVRDVVAGVTIRISVDRDGRDANASSGVDSQGPSISGDGHAVAFFSYAGDLIDGRGDSGADVFLARC